VLARLVPVCDRTAWFVAAGDPKMEGYFGIAAFAVIVVLAILSMVWRFRRADSLLLQWADRHGYRIINQEYRSFLKGPFFWTSSKGQMVYYVTVKDSEGNIRRGWVRCGGWFIGMLSDHVDVSWDY
jgi:hypothetical protein